MGDGLRQQFLRQLPRTRNPPQPGQRHLAGLLILAQPLAGLPLVTADIQKVILNLVGQTDAAP